MKKKVIFSVILVILICGLMFIFGSKSFAEPLENGQEVQKDSDLTYYLTVNYDGKDYDAVESSDTQISKISSDVILVEDRIPYGLTFKGFVETNDGSIGAVKRSDGSSCAGYVVDGVNGLKYDTNTGVVSYKVKNLMAGCSLTVGIITHTPSTVDDPNTAYVEVRRDFYNSATAGERFLTSNSNTVHVFMGEENATLYNVKYEYTGDIPKGAPDVSSLTSYTANSIVSVLNEVKVLGYKFSGWTSDDVSINNGSFVMPNKNVVLKGSFTKNSTYTVSYKVEGNTPNSYTKPADAKYYMGEVVNVNSLKNGDVVDGYRFLGWNVQSGNVTISTDNDFEMPAADVILVGKFERISYKVSYKFQGINIPSNWSSLLPADANYYPGDKVSVSKDPVATGYKFLGWYSEKSFTMPDSDVVIYGEWALNAGVFEPTIVEEIVNKQSSYKKGDVVNFKITVTNTATYPIKDVMVKDYNSKTKFVESNDYNIMSKSMVKIDSIPANGSVVINASYTVDDDSLKIEVNEVELVGALADNSILNTDKDYKAKVAFNIKRGNVVVNYEIVGEAPFEYVKPGNKTVEYDEKYDSEKVEYYEGYNFDGWYLDSNFKTKYKNGTRLTNNITLYGKFVKISNPITRTIHTMYHKYIYLLILGVMFVCVVLFKIVRRVKFYRMEKSARK